MENNIKMKSKHIAHFAILLAFTFLTAGLYAQTANMRGAVVDTKISRSDVDVIFRYFGAIEKGDFKTFISTLGEMEDGADSYFWGGLQVKFFGDIVGVDEAAYKQAVGNGDDLEPFFSKIRSAPLRNRNTGQVIKEMKIVTDHTISGYNELIKVVIKDNKNKEMVHFIHFNNGGIYRHFEK